MPEPRKPVFDAIRAELPDVWNDPGNILALDNLLDAFGFPRGNSARKTSDEGIALIKRFEGLRLQAYPDPGSGSEPWTIGIGTTVYPSGEKVRPGDVITEAQAEEYLRHDLARFEAAVNQATEGVATQGQFDALTSFTYNVGPGAMAGSTLIRKHKAGDYTAAAQQFARWNRAGGRVMAGLTRRRAAEAALYRSGS